MGLAMHPALLSYPQTKPSFQRRLLTLVALATYEPQIKGKIDMFISQLRARQGQALDITQWTMFLTFDIMGKIGFGKDFHQLENGSELSAIKGLHDQMGVLGLLSPLPWLLSLLGSIPGLTGSYGLFMDYCAKQVDEKRRVDPSLFVNRQNS